MFQRFIPDDSKIRVPKTYPASQAKLEKKSYKRVIYYLLVKIHDKKKGPETAGPEDKGRGEKAVHINKAVRTNYASLLFASLIFRWLIAKGFGWFCIFYFFSEHGA